LGSNRTLFDDKNNKIFYIDKNDKNAFTEDIIISKRKLRKLKKSSNIEKL